VYLETVRQRSERVHQSSAQIFPAANQQKVLQAKQKTVQPAKKPTPQAKPFKKPATPDLDHEPPAADDGPGLPSVRKLLAQFEGGDATGPGKAVGRPTVGRLQANLARQHVEPGILLHAFNPSTKLSRWLGRTMRFPLILRRRPP